MSLETFFSQELNFDLAMKPFSWQHGVLVLLGLLSVYVTLKYSHTIKGKPYEKKIKYLFAFWVFALELTYHIHYWMHGMFSVPMHMCSLGAFLSVYILLTDSKKAYSMLFLIGITGGFIALMLPDTLGYPYYNVRYYLFPIMHMNILIVPIFYYKAYGYRINLRSIYITFITIMALLPIANILNKTYDRNYLFIGQEPRILASFLPGWPYYFIIGVIGLFFVFHLLYFLQHTSISTFKKYVLLEFARKGNA